MFRVGQKVVCVDDEVRDGAWKHVGLVLGRIYEVEGFAQCRDGSIGLTFGFDPGWPYYSDRFRPVVERETDISIFTAMLNPSKRRVGA